MSYSFFGGGGLCLQHVEGPGPGTESAPSNDLSHCTDSARLLTHRATQELLELLLLLSLSHLILEKDHEKKLGVNMVWSGLLFESLKI